MKTVIRNKDTITKETEQREKAISYYQQQKFQRFLDTGEYYPQ